MQLKLKILWICCMLVGVTNAQEILSKQEAIKETLENNFGIEIANNDLEIAENNQDILNSGFLPSLTGIAGANYNIEDQEVTFNNGETNVVDGAETTQYNASLNLNYTLFDGLGRWYNYKSLKEAYDLGELQARQTIETTILQLFSVYYEVARITENIEVLEQTFENTKRRLTRAGYSFEYGQVNKLEVLNAEVDIVTDSINLLNARQQLRSTKRDLTVVLNSDLQRNFEVDTTVTFIGELQLEEFVQKSDTANVRLLQARKNIRIADYDYKASKSVYLPSVGLTGSYGWNEGQFPVTSFASSRTTTGFAAGVSLTWNLFDGGSGITTVKNLRIQKDSQQLLLQQIENEVKRDVANAHDVYQNRLEVYRLQEQNVVTASNNYDRSQERYKLGQITSVELRQAQINLLNAKTNKNLAKYEAKLAELELLQLTGQLLNVDF
ncbi:TolC family protein [Marinirhabdus gelatinilytica]|uniref:Outer membrane protein TolC n=1 Tax=Marinirhabdus gelatinilytica TaxID=1703343 RepID=A0A370QL78_9FLAO|nr:TolC family protein [Marinirhabdus gelatinilytica]RDK89133.1 outer membrane protein TolC [Marinirhabdus gelatinilytica]